MAPIKRSHLRSTALLALLAIVVLASPACARKFRAERDGQDIGEAVCDVRSADTPEEAKSALKEFDSKVDDLAEHFALFTAEDRADIRENMSDLVEHASQGNEALAQQDVTVIRRSLDHIRDDVGDTGQAAIDGIYEGMDECVNGS
jgi:hypothetical protein